MTEPRFEQEAELHLPDGRVIPVRRESLDYDDDEDSPTFNQHVWSWVELVPSDGPGCSEEQIT